MIVSMVTCFYGNKSLTMLPPKQHDHVAILLFKKAWVTDWYKSYRVYVYEFLKLYTVNERNQIHVLFIPTLLSKVTLLYKIYNDSFKLTGVLFWNRCTEYGLKITMATQVHL